jgi:hypothetical protein
MVSDKVSIRGEIELDEQCASRVMFGVRRISPGRRVMATMAREAGAI